jgi:transposase
MNYFKQNLGIDVDSDELKVSFQKMDQHQTFKNSTAGFNELLKWVNTKKIADLPVHLTMEATGVYYENLAYYFHEQKDFIVHVLLPNMSSAYMKSLNSKSKTDKIDAGNLAQMGLERKLTQWNPGSSQMRTLKKLVRERLRLQKEKTMVSNQLHAENKSHLPCSNITNRCEERIDFIDQQIALIEKELRDQVKKDPVLQGRIDNVCTAPGVRFITAIGLIAETDGFTLFKNRSQLVSYAGYDVVKNESGKTVTSKTKISKKGNSYIRHMLYMPGMSATTHNPQYNKLHARITETSKIKMKGNVAVQRKLLLLVYTLFKNNTTFDDNYQQKVEDQLAIERNQKKQLAEQRRIKEIKELIKREDKTVDHVQDMAYSG